MKVKGQAEYDAAKQDLERAEAALKRYLDENPGIDQKMADAKRVADERSADARRTEEALERMEEEAGLRLRIYAANGQYRADFVAAVEEALGWKRSDADALRPLNRTYGPKANPFEHLLSQIADREVLADPAVKQAAASHKKARALSEEAHDRAWKLGRMLQRFEGTVHFAKESLARAERELSRAKRRSRPSGPSCTP